MFFSVILYPTILLGGFYAQIVTFVIGVAYIFKWLYQFVFGIINSAPVGFFRRQQCCYNQYYYGNILGLYVIGVFCR